MTIYVDVVLIENLLMNYIIIFATGTILKIKIKQRIIIFKNRRNYVKILCGKRGDNFWTLIQ